jgi:hypothetical protein
MHQRVHCKWMCAMRYDDIEDQPSYYEQLWHGVIIYDTLRPRRFCIFARTRSKHVFVPVLLWIPLARQGSALVSECPDDAKDTQPLRSRTCFFHALFAALLPSSHHSLHQERKFPVPNHPPPTKPPRQLPRVKVYSTGSIRKGYS